MGFKAEIIADSINNNGDRLTTFVVEFPRIVLAEFNTHRMLSRNSASSRAIPFEKMLERVENEPFIPLKWMKDHKGMQGNDYFTDKEVEDLGLLKDWLQAKTFLVNTAKALSKNGLTKQVVNRLLEPFLWHKVIVTATDWENFFALRADEPAEIHIQHLAFMMLEEYNKSSPKILQEGEWHIPFGDKFDLERLKLLGEDRTKNAVKIATARCARVSYMNFEGKDDYNADLKLHDTLSASGHFSPFEHCAMSMDNSEYYGNFKGFKQYRKMLQGENKSDLRVAKIYAKTTS